SQERPVREAGSRGPRSSPPSLDGRACCFLDGPRPVAVPLRGGPPEVRERREVVCPMFVLWRRRRSVLTGWARPPNLSHELLRGSDGGRCPAGESRVRFRPA